MSINTLETKAGADLLPSQQVADRLAGSVRTLWRLVAAGKVPQPVRYNRKLVRWKTADVTHYIASLTAEAQVGPCEPPPQPLDWRQGPEGPTGG